MLLLRYCYYYCGTFLLLQMLSLVVFGFTHKKKLFWCVCFYLFSYNPIRMALWNNVTNFAARLYLCVWEMERTHRAIFTFTCQRHTLLLTDLGFAIKNHAKNRAHCFILFSVFIRWCTRKRDACALFQLAKWAFSKGFFFVWVWRWFVLFFCELNTIPFLILEWDALFEFNRTIHTNYKQSLLRFIFVIILMVFFLKVAVNILIQQDKIWGPVLIPSCFCWHSSQHCRRRRHRCHFDFPNDFSKSFLKFKNVCYLNLMI